MLSRLKSTSLTTIDCFCLSTLLFFLLLDLSSCRGLLKATVHKFIFCYDFSTQCLAYCISSRLIQLWNIYHKNLNPVAIKAFLNFPLLPVLFSHKLKFRSRIVLSSPDHRKLSLPIYCKVKANEASFTDMGNHILTTILLSIRVVTVLHKPAHLFSGCSYWTPKRFCLSCKKSPFYVMSCFIHSSFPI